MIACRVSAPLLVALIVLAGCKKKPAGGPEDTQPDGVPVLSVLGVAPAPGATGPAVKMVAALDQVTREIEQDKPPSFWALMGGPVKPKGLVAVDATAGRADLDAAFGRFWAAWESRPERIRQSLVRQRVEQLTKQGVPPDRAKEQAEQAFRPLPPLRVTTPNPDLDKQYFTRIEADVAGGVQGIWSQNGGMNVSGTVEFSELLRLQCNGDLSARLRGRVGKLDLHANGSVVADLADLQAPVVEARPNGNLFLRLGPGTGVLKLDGLAVTATVMVRGNPGLKVEGKIDRDPRVVVIHY